VAFTDVFTGTFSAGTFTAQSGTQTATSCTQISGTSCQSTTLNSPTSFVTVSGAVTAAGGTIDVTSTGAGGIAQIAETYTFAAGSGGGGASTTEYLLQEPLAGGTPTQIYSSSTSYNLLGANDSLVVFYTSSAGTTSLFTTPVSASPAATSATTLGASPYTGTISLGSSFMLPTTAGDSATSLVFLTVINTAASPTSYSSEVLSPSGSVEQSLTSNSAFLYFAASPLSGSVIQVQNIGTSGGYGGGTFYNVKPANLTGSAAGTAITTTGGAAYTVPANTLAGLVGLSSTIGAGDLEATGATSGLAYDLSQNLIVPVTLTNTNVSIGL
jgi:hypothetical protein